jgi:carbonic anhydrase
MSVTDELLENAERYAADFDKGTLPLPPAKRVAVVACMDARLNPYGLLGLAEGGPRDQERGRRDHRRRDSLALHFATPPRDGRDRPHPPHRLRHAHVRRRRLSASAPAGDGHQTEWAAEAFEDLEEDVRQSIARIQASPFIPRKDTVRGFVYDVTTGTLSEVS